MLDLASPRVIYDVHAESWASYVTADRERYARLLTWAREQGLDPEKIYRLEVYCTKGKPSAQVFEYAFNEQGYRYCDVDHDHVQRVGACRSAKREPYEVILSGLPPDL
jgi:hypothetical protein